MAYFGFTNKLRAGDTIQIFNYGNCKRDFTYVDDIVEGVKRVMQAAPEKKNGEDGLPIPPYAVYNIGNSHPENLLEFVDILQQELISAAAEKTGFSKKDTEATVTAVLETIISALEDNEKVQLVGFGSFEVKERAARIGRNPKTKEAIEIPASKAPVFKPSKALKDILAK